LHGRRQAAEQIAELMPGIGHRNRLGARRNDVAGNTAANSSDSSPRVLMPNSEANDSLNLIKWGFATGVGESRAKKCSGRRA
jgi:hypothetical protein